MVMLKDGMPMVFSATALPAEDHAGEVVGLAHWRERRPHQGGGGLVGGRDQPGPEDRQGDGIRGQPSLTGLDNFVDYFVYDSRISTSRVWGPL
jgi:hypothetical protein